MIENFGNRPTLLLGHSRGGGVATLCSNNPSVIGVVGIMANYWQPTPPTPEAKQLGFQMEYRDLPPGNIRTEKKNRIKLPVSFFEDGIKHDPSKILKQCKKPKLMIYANKDEFINPVKVKELYKEIPEPKKILEVNSVHDHRIDSNVLQQVNDTIRQFVDTL